jgi:hypothetical protein
LRCLRANAAPFSYGRTQSRRPTLSRRPSFNELSLVLTKRGRWRRQISITVLHCRVVLITYLRWYHRAGV